MNKKILIILILFILLCTGCSKKNKFAKGLEDFGFECSEDYMSCVKKDNRETHNNGTLEYVDLEHYFTFNSNNFLLYFNNTAFSTDDVLYEYHYSAVYYYQDESCLSKEHSNGNEYEYNTATQELTIEINKGVFHPVPDSTNTYNCNNTNYADVEEKCIQMLDYCNKVREMFYNYLGDYEVEDILT